MNGLAPRWASAPGATVKSLMQERGLSAEALAFALGLSTEELESLLEGKLSIDAGRAAHLSGVLGASPRFWLTREAEYTEDRLRVRADIWAAQLPLRQMKEFGWIRDYGDWRARIKECLEFFGVDDFEDWGNRYSREIESAHFRKSPTFDSDQSATIVWFRAGERESYLAKQRPVFEPRILRSLIPSIRALTREADPGVFIPELRRISAAAGFTIAVVRAPDGCKASGATRWVDGRPIVQLSARHRSDDHFWFTLFHEIGHVLCHGQTAEPFVDYELDSTKQDRFEREADQFANDTLLGAHSSLDALRSARKRDVIRSARALGVSPGVLAGQLQYRGLVPQSHLNDLKRRYHWDCAKLIAQEHPSRQRTGR